MAGLSTVLSVAPTGSLGKCGLDRVKAGPIKTGPPIRTLRSPSDGCINTSSAHIGPPWAKHCSKPITLTDSV